MANIKEITNPKADWHRVMKATKMTVGKEYVEGAKEPSDKFKRNILLAEHSPIRLLEYDITIEDIQQWVTTHLVRHHEGFIPFVHTQRIDRNEGTLEFAKQMYDMLVDVGFRMDTTRDALPQGTRNEMMVALNAQAFINVSRKRLCYGCASTETRRVWVAVIAYLGSIDPILAEKCVPECLYRGFCPEFKSCGFCDTKAYADRLAVYRSKE